MLSSRDEKFFSQIAVTDADHRRQILIDLRTEVNRRLRPFDVT
jgi:hypothetical protein